VPGTGVAGPGEVRGSYAQRARSACPPRQSLPATTALARHDSACPSRQRLPATRVLARHENQRPGMKRLLDRDSLRALARGCAVLGAGGGGDPYLGLLQALQATDDFGPVSLVDLDELPDDALIMPCGGIGAPTVSIEKIENGDEGDRLREHLEYL